MNEGHQDRQLSILPSPLPAASSGELVKARCLVRRPRVHCNTQMDTPLVILHPHMKTWLRSRAGVSLSWRQQRMLQGWIPVLYYRSVTGGLLCNVF